MRRLVATLSLLLLALAALHGCGVPTQLVVIVDSPLIVGEEIDALQIRLRGENAQVLTTLAVTLGRRPSQHLLPGSFGLAPPGGDSARQVTIEIDAMLHGCTLFTTRTRVGFIPGRRLEQRITLPRSCAMDPQPAGQTCPEPRCPGLDQTCGPSGTCIPIAEPQPNGLPVFDAGDPQQPIVDPAVPTNGNAIVISRDDHIAVAANRTAHSISVLDVAFSAPRTSRVVERAILPTGPGSEPWAVVMRNDGDTAYAILRREQRAIRITHLRTTPAIDRENQARTGSEPTGLALSPTGARLYVANWGEGTVTVIDTASMGVVNTIDLNPSLVETGALGPNAVARRGLAHPRGITITNDGDGDDNDETAYVTEFFSQARTTGVPTTDDRWDLARQGVVYRFGLSTGVQRAITISPQESTGFLDSNNNETGCFPNLLYAATINHDRVYISGMCASPRGPIGAVTHPGVEAVDTRNFQTLMHSALWVIGVREGAERRAEHVLLPRRFDQAFRQCGADPENPDQAPLCRTEPERRRYPLLPLGLTFVPGSYLLYVPSYGSDALFRVYFDTNGKATAVGDQANPWIDLAPGGAIPPGRLPVGVAIGYQNHNFGLVLNANSRNVSIVVFRDQEVIGAVNAGARPADEAEAARNDGRRFFVTGLDRYSYLGQATSSCEGCHPDGLSDNVTWFFARGPRQSIPLDGSIGPDGSQRIFNWTAVLDEVQDLEAITRTVSGGVGAIVWRDSSAPVASDRIGFDGTAPQSDPFATLTPQNGLNGSTASISSPGRGLRSVRDDFDRILAYVRTIRSPRAPTGLPARDIEQGRADFVTHNCVTCHGGPRWTISRRFYTPSEGNNHPVTGLLVRQIYERNGLRADLNPAAAMGPAFLRAVSPDDSIQCVLRAVGTYVAPFANGVAVNGVAPDGVLVSEVRQNMTDAAQGELGYNPPSLLGVAHSAPYFHAGNARTLEELFGDAFLRHHRARSTNFLIGVDQARTEALRHIVTFLLSIDDEAPTLEIPGGSAMNPPSVLCPDIPDP